MGFCESWDTIYRSQNQLSVWPWSDLVSYVYRYTQIPQKPRARVLELGCGAGANIRLFQTLRSDYHAVEGSAYMVERLKAAYPEYAQNIRCGDFTKDLMFEGGFDLIFDRSAVTHNLTADIKKLLGWVAAHLNHGGMYIAIDWFSLRHGESSRGREVAGDRYTRFFGDNDHGQFHNCGLVHFSDEAHLKELFSGFTFKALEERTVDYLTPARPKLAVFNLAAVPAEDNSDV